MCATLGVGLSSACVVDVGDHKTSISCVEDGMSLEPTRLVCAFSLCFIFGVHYRFLIASLCGEDLAV